MVGHAVIVSGRYCIQSNFVVDDKVDFDVHLYKLREMEGNPVFERILCRKKHPSDRSQNTLMHRRSGNVAKPC